MGFYKRSREHRKKIVNLMQQGKTIEQAEDIVLKGNSNRSRNLAKWKQLGLCPYGDIDPPIVPTLPPKVLPTVPDGAVAQPSVVQLHDSVALDKLHTIVDERVDKLMAQEISLITERLKALENAFGTQSYGASVVKLRPRLKRKQGDTIPTSFRFPKELVRRARVKAKSDPIGSAGLNALVETLLFDYIGSPDDLLDK